ncbi:hypothetical protein PG995_004569 [Apiospora arundinis]
MDSPSPTMPPACNHRPIRPAPLPLDAQHTLQQPKGAKEQPAKRKTTEVACQACRTRKSKCNGASPQCATCAKRDTECIYLRRKDSEVGLLLQSHQELYDIIRTGSEEEGLEIVRWIRGGHDVDSILGHIRDGDAPSHSSNHESVAITARERPSIQALLNSADTTANLLNPESLQRYM